MEMWPTEDPMEQLRWRIPCTNPAAENRRVTVLVMGDRVAVVVPPAQILVFEPDEADDLAALLDNAAEFAGEESAWASSTPI
ncbi:hypothetical protein HUO13_01445 [Saccharopolyspora erythraea]|nr:hypothetical protein HUO13_01445 [Saccharopolyspora erythraea]